MLERGKGQCVFSEGTHAGENERTKEWVKLLLSYQSASAELTQSCENSIPSTSGGPVI